MAGSHVATLRKLPQEIVVATGLFADGDLEAAEALIRAYLLRHGDHIEAMRLLARIGIAHKVYDDAELLLAAVLELAPDYRIARQEYAGVLVELHRYAAGAPRARSAAQGRPRQPRAAHAVRGDRGGHRRARARDRAVPGAAHRRRRADAEVHLSIGHALKTLGRTPEAIDSYRRAAACRPDYGDAYWSLANLKTYRFARRGVRARSAQRSRRSATGTVDRYHLCFALAKALEDQGEFAESFRYYELGNALKRPECRYRPEIIENNTRQQIRVCTRSCSPSRHGWGCSRAAIRFSSSDCRARARRCSSRSSPRTRRSRARQELPNIQQLVTRLRGRDPGS